MTSIPARRLALALHFVLLLPLFAGPLDDLKLRVRITQMEPEQPVRIMWRWGGEGLGGDVVSGELTAVTMVAPPADQTVEDEVEFSLEDAQNRGDRIIEEGDSAYLHWLRLGAWSPPQPLRSLKRGGRLFLTLTLLGKDSERGRGIRNVIYEFELRYKGKAMKQFTATAPDGHTAGLVIPMHLLKENEEPSAAFYEAFVDIRRYAEQRAAHLAAMPWAERPTPRLYDIVTDCNGYREGGGYGIRTSDKEAMLAEFRTLRLMGINGTRGAPGFIIDLVRKQEGLGQELASARLTHTVGYPINMIGRADGRPPTRRPGDGCPYQPENLKVIHLKVAAAMEELMAQARTLPVQRIWGLTVDEIGSVFDGAPEGKDHMGACPYCREAFREMIKADGLTPADFGAPDWEPIRATYGYWAIDFWESQRILAARLRDAQTAVENAAKQAANERLTAPAEDVVGDELTKDLLDEVAGKPRAKTAAELTAEVDAAKARYELLDWRSVNLEVPEEERQLKVSPEGWTLLTYYSRRFNNLSSARCFQPLAEAIAKQNAAKQAALDEGRLDAPEAKQPWIYSYALRGNTFLMGGHSLDFFDFYRFADNAMVYETSNRDSRVWQWDSYLCDVGRSLNLHYGKPLGVYVKPHRGAPVQRALTAVARGSRMVYWYTYGPEWAKGDTFGPRLDLLEKIGWFARLLAEAEDVTWESDWAAPAEVAIVRPRTAEFFSGNASWEDGKWVYTALMHAHIPVMAMDETMLLNQDLSGYKVIYICGSHLRRDVADKLRDWVAAGGTLVTDGYGMAHDQAGRPLEQLYPVFGVSRRQPAEEWGEVRRYGATSLSPITQKSAPPAGAAVAGTGALRGTHLPAVGREVLHPLPEAEVMARYADGGAAAIRHAYGKGQAWLIGTWAGMEYANDPMQKQPYDDGKRSFVAGPVLAAGVQPVVDAASPRVEGVLLKHQGDERRALVLINWGEMQETPMVVRLRATGPATTIRSLALEQSFPLAVDGEWRTFSLPSLAEGDILLLE